MPANLTIFSDLFLNNVIWFLFATSGKLRTGRILDFLGYIANVPDDTYDKYDRYVQYIKYDTYYKYDRYVIWYDPAANAYGP